MAYANGARYWTRDVYPETAVGVIVTNMEAKEQTVSVDFSKVPEKIGNRWKIWNAQSKTAFTRSGNTVIVTLPPKDFLLVRIAPTTSCMCN